MVYDLFRNVSKLVEHCREHSERQREKQASSLLLTAEQNRLNNQKLLVKCKDNAEGALSALLELLDEDQGDESVLNVGFPCCT